MKFQNILNGAVCGLFAVTIASAFFTSCKKDNTKLEGWNLVWNDEFNGKQLDTEKWGFQIGTGSQYGLVGWGNNELQYYTKDNAYIENGSLVLEAKKEEKGGMHYTSSRIRTMAEDESPLFTKTYGRIEAKIKMPKGSGFWPAFWMLPATDAYSTWAASGELDIMEAKGRLPNRVYGTLHFGQPSPGNRYSGSMYKFPDEEKIDGWHVYAVEWEPDSIKWLVDGNVYYEMSQWWSIGANQKEPYAYPAPYDKPFYILINFALGGNFDGDAVLDESLLPAKMYIDYVRVYDKEEGYPEKIERPALKADKLTMSPAKAEIALSDTVSFSATADEGLPVKPEFSITESGISGSQISNSGTLIPGKLDAGKDTAEITVTAKYQNIESKVPVTVIKEKDFSKFFSTSSHTNGGNNEDEAAFQYPGYMCLWADEGWCGSQVSITDTVATEKFYSVTREVTGENWFNTQIFYVLDAGNYDVSFTMKSTSSGFVTIGQLGEENKVVELKANQPKKIEYNVNNIKKGQILSLQLGSGSSEPVNLPDGTFTISDFSVTKK